MGEVLGNNNSKSSMRGIDNQNHNHDNASSSATMRPSSALDLFILTFNCAKTLINVPVFSAHLHAALSQNATGLPDLVVLSLQEVAPMSYAFIGSYFLNPYYARFGEALNLASTRLLEKTTTTTTTSYGYPESVSSQGTLSPPPYTLVRAKNVGMTSILLFARDPTSISQIQEAECGFGAADMGNKGAVGLRVTWSDPSSQSQKSAELTLVATHLAAMEWNLKKRNANWRSIVSGLTFQNPRDVLPGVFPATANPVPRPDLSGVGERAPPPPPAAAAGGSVDSSEAEEEEVEEAEPLLSTSLPSSSSSELPLTRQQRSLSPSQSATLQDISIFKPSSHLFVAGDLNYRISSTTPPPLSEFPSFDESSPNHYSNFLERDQLTQERLAGRTFHGMEEAPVTFGPTYKFDILKDSPRGAVNEAAVRKGSKVNGVPEVAWKFAPHRWPGWCDRVLFSSSSPSGGSEEDDGVKVGGYDAFPVLESSDHRPVWFRASVPLFSSSSEVEAEAREEDQLKGAKFMGKSVGEVGEVGERKESKKQKKVLPFPVDVDAWERRRIARGKEMVVGWSAFFWSTQEGAMVLGTVLLIVLGGWWAVRGW
ncbi:Endonuclease/exonuclease/phosphatase [Cladorrhinum sp. PSN332]|nr:Endonuclease/exonuclease/phosphatase [Cladorrhinum sp. PSN332]